MDFFNTVKDGVLWLWGIDPLREILEAFFRIMLAALLSGIIGYEREHSHRPAGFRTHILVAIGSTLVMLTAVHMSETSPNVTLDVSRMSAAVITGIGFLGAGTILREGFSVKGLTTAASLWAVACIGTAVGGGYATGAVVATVVIYFTLNSLKHFVINGSVGKTIYIEVESIENELPAITSLIKDRFNAPIHSAEIVYTTSADKKYKHNKNNSVIKILAFPKNDKVLSKIISSLKELQGVEDVYVD